MVGGQENREVRTCEDSSCEDEGTMVGGCATVSGREADESAAAVESTHGE